MICETLRETVERLGGHVRWVESSESSVRGRSSDAVERLHEQLQKSLRALVSSDDWRQALEVAARFHDYSFANTRLIWVQATARGFTPTRVAGYRAWQKLGRQVNRGEKGLQVLAPVTRKVEANDAPKGGPLRGANFRKKVWLPAVAEVRLGDLVVHDLRDTAASLAISSGASIKAVQRMLGHASAAMTLDVYGGLYDEDLERLADRLEELHDSYLEPGAAQSRSPEVVPLESSRRSPPHH